MWHKPCRTFHPWCPCIKTRCLSLTDSQMRGPNVKSVTNLLKHGPNHMDPSGPPWAYWIPCTHLDPLDHPGPRLADKGVSCYATVLKRRIKCIMSSRKCHLLRMRPLIKNTETNWTIFYKKLKNNTTMIFSTNIRITWGNHGGLLKILFIKIKNLRVSQNSNYLTGIWLVTKRSFQKNSMIFLSMLVQLWLKKSLLLTNLHFHICILELMNPYFCLLLLQLK